MTPEAINDLDDPRIADYRDVRDADLRGGGGFAPRGERPDKLFMAESELVVRRLLESRRFEVKSLFLSHERLATMHDVIEACATGTPVFLAEEPLMRSIAGYRHHHGALAAGYRPLNSDLAPSRLFDHLRSLPRFVVPLVSGVTNVDNIGTIFRNAAAFGAAGVLLDGDCADPLFRLSIRVSMGHVFNVPWASAPDGCSIADMMISARVDCGATVIALESGVGGLALRDLPRAERAVLVFGSERRGLSRATLDRCDAVCEIPMAGSVDSINVAVATAVALYEWGR